MNGMEDQCSNSDESDAEFDRLLALSAIKSARLHRTLAISSHKTISSSCPRWPTFRRHTDDDDESPLDATKPSDDGQLPICRGDVPSSEVGNSDDYDERRRPEVGLKMQMTSSPSTPAVSNEFDSNESIIIFSSTTTDEDEVLDDEPRTPDHNSVERSRKSCKLSSDDESEAEFDRLMAVSAVKSLPAFKRQHRQLPSQPLTVARCPVDDNHCNDESRSPYVTSISRQEHICSRGSSSAEVYKHPRTTTFKPNARCLLQSVSSNSAGSSEKPVKTPKLTSSYLAKTNDGPIIQVISSTSESGSSENEPPTVRETTGNLRRRVKQVRIKALDRKTFVSKTEPVPNAKILTSKRVLVDMNPLPTVKVRWQDLFDDSLTDNDLDDVIIGEQRPIDSRNDANRFLRSLDVESPRGGRHADAVPFVTNFGGNARSLLAHKLFRLYNQHIFEGRLPSDLPITWNSRMTKTAGFCRCSYLDKYAIPRTKMCSVDLSVPLLKTPDRVRDTLVHELCHAATWLLSKYWDVHGPFWRCWARRANIVFPSLPMVTRCHNYTK